MRGLANGAVEVHRKMDFSPIPVVTSLSVEGKQVHVVRDDLLPGGTKQRAAVPYIAMLAAQGIEHFVYASPFSGFAQVALAHACAEVGVDCTLFCEKDSQNYLHEFSRLAQSHGAKVILCENLPSAETQAHSYVQGKASTMVIPLGFNDDLFRSQLKQNIEVHWQKLSEAYNIEELWLPVGSGTLLSVFSQIVDPSVQIHAVNVNVLPESDRRIRSIRELSSVEYIRSPQKFHEPCQRVVPVPSNLYYDAKLFAPIQDKASDGAFWWNVAR